MEEWRSIPRRKRERIFGKMFISNLEDGAVLSIAYRSESWVSRDHPTHTMFRTRGEEEIGEKIGEGRTRGFRAINYRDRVGRGARDGKYPVTSGYTEEEEEEGKGGKKSGYIRGRIKKLVSRVVELDKFVGSVVGDRADSRRALHGFTNRWLAKIGSTRAGKSRWNRVSRYE